MMTSHGKQQQSRACAALPDVVERVDDLDGAFVHDAERAVNSGIDPRLRRRIETYANGDFEIHLHFAVGLRAGCGIAHHFCALVQSAFVDELGIKAGQRRTRVERAVLWKQGDDVDQAVLIDVSPDRARVGVM